MSALFTEVMVPVILLCVGTAFSKVAFFIDANPRPIVPSLFENSQTVFVNSNPMISSSFDISPDALIKSMPGYSEKFLLSTIETTKSISDPADRAKALSDFDLEIYSQRQDEVPYRYLGYYVLEANNYTKQFKIAALMNTTS